MIYIIRWYIENTDCGGIVGAYNTEETAKHVQEKLTQFAGLSYKFVLEREKVYD